MEPVMEAKRGRAIVIFLSKGTPVYNVHEDQNKFTIWRAIVTF